jgi:hypothetical protein
VNNQRDRNKKTIINYAPEALRTFQLFSYVWIDNLNFTLDPHECLDSADEYLSIVKEIFLEDGWDGDGDVELMWIPPFVFNENKLEEPTLGITVWHVKQLEDGVSWILAPQDIFDALQDKREAQ